MIACSLDTAGSLITNNDIWSTQNVLLVQQSLVGQLLKGGGRRQHSPLADFANLGDDDVDGYPGVIQAVTG